MNTLYIRLLKRNPCLARSCHRYHIPVLRIAFKAVNTKHRCFYVFYIVIYTVQYDNSGRLYKMFIINIFLFLIKNEIDTYQNKFVIEGRGPVIPETYPFSIQNHLGNSPLSLKKFLFICKL